MHILITGKNGQLGSEIQALVTSYPAFNFLFTGSEDLDVSNSVSVQTYFKTHSIDLVLNCAAFTAVDNAEDNIELADKINNIAVKNLVEVCIEYNVRIIHISTDYVFDGCNYKPYVETDTVNPKSVYGITKYNGEQQLLNSKIKGLVIRTSWVYSAFGNNFVKTMIRLGKERESLSVISDQVGTPTYAGDLAKACLDIASQLEKWPQQPEVYHYSNEGVCSWYDFSIAIMKQKELNIKVMPIETKDYPTKAKRPYYSVLNKAKIKRQFNIEIPHWEHSLDVLLCSKNL